MIAVLQQALIAGIGIGAVYALVAYGISIVWSVSRTLNLAHGDILMVCVFISLVASFLRVPGPVAIAIAIAAGAAIGAGVNKLVFRPLREAPGSMAWLLGVVIFAALIRSVGIWLFESRSYPAPFTIGGGGRIDLPGGAVVATSYLWLVLAAMVLAVGVELLMSKTSFGLAIKAVAHSRESAELLGVNSERVMTAAFALAAALGAVGGILIAPVTFVSVSMGWMLTLKGFTAAVIGGLGLGRGVLLGGILLGLMEQALAAAELLVPESSRVLFSAGARDVLVFLVLIAVLVVRPEGLAVSKGVRS